jgi:hypothetical protein
MMFSPLGVILLLALSGAMAAHEPVNCTDCALHER